MMSEGGYLLGIRANERRSPDDIANDLEDQGGQVYMISYGLGVAEVYGLSEDKNLKGVTFIKRYYIGDYMDSRVLPSVMLLEHCI